MKRIKSIHIGAGGSNHTARWTPAEKLLLVVLGGVVFLDTLDLSLVQVALPAIGSELRLPEAQLQWIVSAFVLGYGGVLLFCGPGGPPPPPESGPLGGLGAPVGAAVPRPGPAGRKPPVLPPLLQKPPPPLPPP